MAEQYIDTTSLEFIRKYLWQVSNSDKITLEDVQDRVALL